MDRPVALLHVVGSEQVGDTSKLVKEVVLETEHRGRADNGGLGVDGADDLLAPGLYVASVHRISRHIAYSTNLGGKELRRRVPAGIVGGNVDEAVHVVLGNSLGDALGTVNVHVDVGEVPE